MISKTFAFTFILSSAVLSSSAFAGADVDIIDAYAWGNGCPNGSAQIIYTNSWPSGLRDFSLVTFDDFDVALHKHRHQVEKRCKIQLAVRIPRGYTLQAVDLEVKGQYNLPGPRSTATVYTTLTTRGLRYRNNVHRSGFVFNHPEASQANFTETVRFSDIGSIYARECHRSRIALLTTEIRAVIRHRGGRAADHSFLDISQVSSLFSRADSSSPFTATPCAGYEDEVLGNIKPAY